MSQTTKFSIITVCRNEEANIRSTCESITKQTFKNFEWIVIDGASTDQTVKILEEFRHNMTQLISEPDNGIYDAMNKGIDLAKSEYVVFMNGGDTFATNHALALVANAPQKDLIYGDLRYDSKSGEVRSYPDYFRSSDLLKWMIPHQASFYRRTLFKKYGNYDTRYRIAGDYELNVRMICKYHISQTHIKEPLGMFNRTGISSSKNLRMLRKQENHRIRMNYFASYRWSLKAWRQILRNRFLKEP